MVAVALPLDIPQLTRGIIGSGSGSSFSSAGAGGGDSTRINRHDERDLTVQGGRFGRGGIDDPLYALVGRFGRWP